MRFIKKSHTKAVAAVCLSALISGCGVKTMYEWDGYSSHLLSYYKHPEELQKFSEKLYDGIQKAEETNTVPPGIYAEYGYVQLAMNDMSTAALYFTKEKEKWPESAYLMDKALGKIAKMPSDETTDIQETNETAGATK
ncbi:DUF4810 domain-containing protein [Paremcibacter congregatus]|uniref:DUF4810 domain-containing protein n=1 Tax=Paremcibacter congregatus TaxID=2043170 RepID=A0A2G4YLW6_9PROT|nr:DUF4810 domain-containing protein [Paremcibacter congregatus]PHZ83302.1 DUF4810 domain-containing protein [Paremcibacter congregatus]QDE28224.1 DUF4810 domain-containing protein [Paremcibacter congregatus]